MVCSYGDYNDVQLFRELGLKEIIAIGQDGRMLPVAGEGLAGLRVKRVGRRWCNIAKDGLLYKVEGYFAPYAFVRAKQDADRDINGTNTISGSRRQGQVRAALLERVGFHPEMHRTILLKLDWGSQGLADFEAKILRDWGAVWYCKACNEPFLPPPGPYTSHGNIPTGNPVCPKCKFKGIYWRSKDFDTWMDF